VKGLTVSSRVNCIGLAWVFVVALVVSGCGGASDPYARVPISGIVKLDGEPLANGYFVFEPMSGQPTQSGGMIHNGVFEVAKQHGPVPGKYSVQIFSGADPLPSGPAPGTPEAEAAAKKSRGERVPSKYNIQTTLQREVTAVGENKFDFDLSTK
jgi:hypothetical protein